MMQPSYGAWKWGLWKSRYGLCFWRVATVLALQGIAVFVGSGDLAGADGVPEASDARGSVTISDEQVYGSDGRLFTGVIKLVPIKGTETGDPMFLPVTDGVLHCKLNPLGNDWSYIALFLRHDRVEAQERWVVPNVPYTLRTQDVKRGGAIPTVDTISPRAATGTINESDVIGLVADLGARPVKGPAYTAMRVAVINSAGMLESAIGSPSECVRVDGTSGPCGISSDSGSTPSGAVASVFGRKGDVAATSNDYAGIYEPVDQSLVRSSGQRPVGAVPAYDAFGRLIPSLCSATVDGLKCGNGVTSSAVSLFELKSNGDHAFTIYGKDRQAVSVCIVLPDASPQPGQVLAVSSETAVTSDGRQCPVMMWLTIAK
jgi:hypothetical protein